MMLGIQIGDPLVAGNEPPGALVPDQGLNDAMIGERFGEALFVSLRNLPRVVVSHLDIHPGDFLIGEFLVLGKGRSFVCHRIFPVNRVYSDNKSGSRAEARTKSAGCCSRSHLAPSPTIRAPKS